MELQGLVGFLIMAGVTILAVWLGRPRYRSWRERRTRP